MGKSRNRGRENTEKILPRSSRNLSFILWRQTHKKRDVHHRSKKGDIVKLYFVVTRGQIGFRAGKSGNKLCICERVEITQIPKQ